MDAQFRPARCIDVRLIRSQLDFKPAENLDLLLDGLKWTQWRILLEERLVNIGRFLEDRVSPRYHYSELRRPCNDTIYRFTPRFFLRYSIAGYFYEEDLAVVFYKRQVAWPVVSFASFSLILSAMQVGFAVTPLNDNYVLVGSHMALLFLQISSSHLP